MPPATDGEQLAGIENRQLAEMGTQAPVALSGYVGS